MSSAEFNKVASQIKTLRSKGDVAGFNSRVFLYLTNQDRWYDADETAPNVRDKSVLASSPYYDAKTALQVDAELISAIAHSIFVTKNSRVKLSDEFIPRLTLGYILSHPLLPVGGLPGLLSALEEYDVQFLLTSLNMTQSLPISEIVAILVSTLTKKSRESKVYADIIRQSVLRLEHDFSYRSIVRTISVNYTIAEIQAALEALLAFISSAKSDESEEFDVYHILSCFVDAAGLFSLQPDILDKTSKLVEQQITDIQGRIEVLEIVDSALEWCRAKKLNKKNKKFAGVPAIRARN